MKKIFALLYVAMMATFMACDDDLKYEDEKVNDYEFNFKFLWKEMDEKYCFFDYKKDSIKNWNDVYNEYLPNVKKCTNDVEFFDLLASMLNELKDGHVNLYTPFDYSHYDIEDNYPKDFDYDLMRYGDRYLGKDIRRCGGFSYKTLREGKVGYIRYPDFTSSFSDSQIDFILTYLQNAYGLIIDVRENGGGIVDNVNSIVQHFVEDKTLVKYFQNKNGTGHSDFGNPIADYLAPISDGVVYKKPVYVLTNRDCFSATNMFVFAMKGLPNVKILGGKTGGGSGLPSSTEIPIGWQIRYSATRMLDKNMMDTEFGVDPDIEVHLDSTSVSQGLDNIIETACDYIEGKIK